MNSWFANTASFAIQNEALRLVAPTLHRVSFALALVALSLFHPATFANEISADETSATETPANSDRVKDWRYDEAYVEYWTRSWECFREQKYECAKQELAPLLEMDLTSEQDAQTRRTMTNLVIRSANAAFWDEDYKTQILHLEEAVELDPGEAEVVFHKLLISQAYRLLEQWSDCARYGEEALSAAIELDKEITCHDAAYLALCHQKSNNFERARHWLAESKRLAQEEQEEWNSADIAGWEYLISPIEDALSNPDAQK